MSRLLGVDFGTVRVGLAITDPERRFASPLTTYTRRSQDKDAEYFKQLVDAEDVAAIVVGLPMHTDGREGKKAVEARAFGEWLQAITSKPVEFMDERFTSVEAEAYLQQAGLTKKRRKSRRDRIAAQLILQGYLEAGQDRQRE